MTTSIYVEKTVNMLLKDKVTVAVLEELSTTNDYKTFPDIVAEIGGKRKIDDLALPLDVAQVLDECLMLETVEKNAGKGYRLKPEGRRALEIYHNQIAKTS